MKAWQVYTLAAVGLLIAFAMQIVGLLIMAGVIPV